MTQALADIATVYTAEGNRLQIYTTDAPMVLVAMMNGRVVPITTAIYQMNRAAKAEARIKAFGVTA